MTTLYRTLTKLAATEPSSLWLRVEHKSHLALRIFEYLATFTIL